MPRALSKTRGEREDSQGAMPKNLLVKVLVLVGSTVSIGFGVWHFFVPRGRTGLVLSTS